MVPNLFFEASQGVTAQLGELFNFTWPTVAALWNLRWQVLGWVETTGKVDHYDLNARFVRGSGVASADLKSACLLSSWEAQQEQFAKFLLFELCSLYEAWLESAVPRAVAPSDVEHVRRSLQFPSSTGKIFSGLQRAIAVVNSDVSRALKGELYPVLVRHPKNSWAVIEQLLIAYRYFKEARNVFIHAGGVVNPRVVDAYAALNALPVTTFGFKNPIPVVTPMVGEKVRLTLVDMVGFSTVVHRLIATLDAALAVSATAEADLVARVKAIQPQLVMLSTSNPARRRQQIVQLLGKARIPKPVVTRLLDRVLVTNGIAV